MFTIHLARTLLGLYAVLLAVGGMLGYERSNSKASLIAGTVSSIICLLALLYSMLAKPIAGLEIGAVVVLLLALFFNYRFVSGTRKFMPAGMLASVSLVVFAFLLIAIL